MSKQGNPMPRNTVEIAQLAQFMAMNVSLLEQFLLDLQRTRPDLVCGLWQQKCHGSVPYPHSLAPCNVINNGFGGI